MLSHCFIIMQPVRPTMVLVLPTMSHVTNSKHDTNISIKKSLHLSTNLTPEEYKPCMITWHNDVHRDRIQNTVHQHSQSCQ